MLHCIVIVLRAALKELPLVKGVAITSTPNHKHPQLKMQLFWALSIQAHDC